VRVGFRSTRTAWLVGLGVPPLKLRLAFGDGDGDGVPDLHMMEARTLGIFAVWWDNKFDCEGEAENVLRKLNEVREDCVANRGMRDPPTVDEGYYFNVYIHHVGRHGGKEDVFSDDWCAGGHVGTNPATRAPYMAIRRKNCFNDAVIFHEGFHVYQYARRVGTIPYAGDSRWFIEATASWYSLDKEMTVDSFRLAYMLTENPHLALWHSKGNGKPEDPKIRKFETRQYAMESFLYFLCEYCNVPKSLITESFYPGISMSPQQYLFTEIGGDRLRDIFPLWAACNTDGISYIERDQFERTMRQLENAERFEPENTRYRNPYVATFHCGWFPESFRPEPALTPRGWSYNVVRFVNDGPRTVFSFELRGDERGSKGGPSHFVGRVLVTGAEESFHMVMDMDGPLNGSGFVEVAAGDVAYVIVAAVPGHFSGNQTYGYELSMGVKDPWW